MKKFIADAKRLRATRGFKGTVWWMLDQSFWLLFFYRLSTSFENRYFRLIFRVLLEKPLEFVTKNYFPFTIKIGGGLILWHPHGLVLNGKAVIGTNCTLYPRVCIGNRWPGDGAPVIHNNVVIGTGACVLGPVEILSNSVIKCNTVVTPDDLSGVKKRK